VDAIGKGFGDRFLGPYLRMMMMVASNHIPAIRQPNSTASVPEKMGESKPASMVPFEAWNSVVSRTLPLVLLNSHVIGMVAMKCELAQGLRATQIEG
jgi:hypothetical protein